MNDLMERGYKGLTSRFHDITNAFDQSNSYRTHHVLPLSQTVGHAHFSYMSFTDVIGFLYC